MVQQRSYIGKILVLILLVQCLMMQHVRAQNLKLCAFNVQTFGKTRMERENYVQTLVQIFARYDFCLFQEIRDTTGEALAQFLHQLNLYSHDTYDLVVSAPLGSGSSKEIYAYVYNKHKLEVSEAKQFASAQLSFERPPFSVIIYPKHSGKSGGVFVTGLHAKPDDTSTKLTVKELNQMVDVYNSYKRDIPNNKWLLMGDLNAGCKYVTSWENIRLRTETVAVNGKTTSKFRFLIGDNVRTNFAQTACAYDRFVVTHDMDPSAGTSSTVQYVQNSAKPFDYITEFGLDKQWAIQYVSDHYPIEMELQNFFSVPGKPTWAVIAELVGVGFMCLLVVVIAILVSESMEATSTAVVTITSSDDSGTKEEPTHDTVEQQQDVVNQDEILVTVESQ